MSAKNDIKNSFRNFLNSEYYKLINYVNSRFSNNYFSADAEDIVQDVAINIYSKLDINAPIENLAAYFYRAIRNKIIDYQRKPNVNTSIENFIDERDENSLLRKLVDSSDEDEPISQNPDLQKKLIIAIDKLKPEEKTIIYEVEFEGKSFEELSIMWEVPIGTLLSRKHRALGKLQKIMKMENEA
ncbi:MAG: RNA polymerase sigma factor [Bacteroidetes bacterium]|jgi:RNA polymerase sigma factor (sigma-70 family)|nr:RNA polymerase sigma factor [Bacteroidota bacterium]MBT6685912.1 RNA polymerase sigma factor [Bacteroidota bacterium]MBT7143131.1 RNA polymerase sigma factor [Bacteroidota bacterium]MBT7491657.1 RNA polymerase sigma factor [Bacteroidota bacterium]